MSSTYLFQKQGGEVKEGRALESTLQGRLPLQNWRSHSCAMDLVVVGVTKCEESGIQAELVQSSDFILCYSCVAGLGSLFKRCCWAAWMVRPWREWKPHQIKFGFHHR